MTNGKIALKPFLESIENICNSVSREELIETILTLAKEVPVGERAD